MNRNRAAGETYLRAKRHLGVSGGMPPQKIFKIQGVSSAFWCEFDTYELRPQLTSALHTRKLRACESQQPERARIFIRARPSAPKMNVCDGRIDLFAGRGNRIRNTLFEVRH